MVPTVAPCTPRAPDAPPPRITDALATCFTTHCSGVIAFVAVAREGSLLRTGMFSAPKPDAVPKSDEKKDVS